MRELAEAAARHGSVEVASGLGALEIVRGDDFAAGRIGRSKRWRQERQRSGCSEQCVSTHGLASLFLLSGFQGIN
ncbi:hypothetical protein D9M69_710240 [compost metagenome]